MKRFILLTITLIAAFSLSGCSYNDLTAKQQNVKGKWSDVESSMQRRADLIPNIVKAAQMAGVQEQEVFGQVAEARSRHAAASKEFVEGRLRHSRLTQSANEDIVLFSFCPDASLDIYAFAPCTTPATPWLIQDYSFQPSRR